MNSRTVENFKLKDQHGNEFDLYDNLGEKILLIFYPKDNSLVCSRQLAHYQENYGRFKSDNIKLIGINIDDLQSHRKFCDEKGISFPLLADKNKAVSRAFGALNILGMNKRKLVLIGTDKRILYEENVSYLNYPLAEELLEKFNNLNN